jgi:hypothetical protein
LEPELTDLIVVAAQGPGYYIFLQVDLALECGVPEGAADLHFPEVPPRWRRLGCEGRKGHSSRCGFGFPLGFLLLEFLLRVPASPIFGGMRFFPFRQPAATTCWGGRCVPLLGALLVQVSAPAQQIARRLLSICPYLAKLLAVVALRKGIWALYASTLITMWQRLGRRKFSRDFEVLCKVIRKRGRLISSYSSGGNRRLVVTCLTLSTSKPRLTSPSEISAAGVSCGRWHITVFMGLSDLGKKEM